MSLRGCRVQLLLWTILPVALLLVMFAGAGIVSHRQAIRDLVEERDHSLVLVEAGRLSRQVDALKATVANLTGEPGFHGDAALAVEHTVAGNEDLGLPAPGHLVLLRQLRPGPLCAGRLGHVAQPAGYPTAVDRRPKGRNLAAERGDAARPTASPGDPSARA